MHQKNWTEVQAQSSWRMFLIMAEFVEGFEKLDKIGPCVSIFGSARTKEENPYYQQAVTLAKKLCEEGYGVITGGGPGIMEAGNRGAREVEGKSVGLNIDLPFEKEPNKFIDFDKLITFNYFFVRKVMFVKYSMAFIAMPGGFGTLDELFESLTLIQTKKIARVPVVLVGKKYWSGMLDWIRNSMLGDEGNINPADLDLIHLTDDLDAVVKIVHDHYVKTSLKPNF